MAIKEDLAIPLGSLVLVTGANGLVGSHVVNELLGFGYRVRGTVRDAVKSDWMTEYFSGRYGQDKFEMVQVKDVAASESLDQALEGCAGLVHVASDLSFSPDPNIIITACINQTKNVLESATKVASIKRVVYTSSSAACAVDRWNEIFDITPETWNQSSIDKAWAPPPYEPERAIHTYSASKAQAEQSVFAFVQERKPHFVVNTVLPDFVTGPGFHEKQGFPSSLGMLMGMWTGDEFYKVVGPQYMIDASDVALLHVAGLVLEDVKNERIMGYGHPKTWTAWTGIFREMFPDHKFLDPPENEGQFLANVTMRPRAEELLKRVSGHGFTPMKESMKATSDYVDAAYKKSQA